MIKNFLANLKKTYIDPLLNVRPIFFHYIQRARHGYSERDLDSLDMYLCSVLPRALRKLQDSDGHPVTVTEAQWKKILEEMAVGFENGKQLHGLLDKQGQEIRMEEQFNRGLKLFHKHFFNLWR